MIYLLIRNWHASHLPVAANSMLAITNCIHQLSSATTTTRQKPNETSRCFYYLNTNSTRLMRYGALPSCGAYPSSLINRPPKSKSSNEETHSIIPAQQTKPKKRRYKKKKFAKSIDFGVYFDPDSCTQIHVWLYRGITICHMFTL